MRLYTGISLAIQIEQNLVPVLERLGSLGGWKPSPIANLHITTKFIGEFPDARLPELNAALAELPRTGPIEIRVAGFGYFPEAANPKSLFATVDAGPELADLAMRTGLAVQRLGVEMESRPYVPHVTLARRKGHSGDVAPVQLDDRDFGTFEATEFHLYSSTPGPAASVYRKLATYSLELNA